MCLTNVKRGDYMKEAVSNTLSEQDITDGKELYEKITKMNLFGRALVTGYTSALSDCQMCVEKNEDKPEKVS